MTTNRKPMLGEALTTRELDVLRCAADGLSTEQSATNLEVTLQTIKFHRANLMTKLGATSIAHAVGIGFKTALLRVEEDDPPVDDDGLSAVVTRLEDVARLLSEVAANLDTAAVATATDDPAVVRIDEPDRPSEAADGAASHAPGTPKPAPRSVYARDR